MKWTTDKPTQPGFYWFRGIVWHNTERLTADELESGVYQVVFVEFALSCDSLQILDGPDWFGELDLTEGEWAGPIPEPD